MQARDYNSERQQLENRVQEIRNFIADNNLELATKRLGYFAEDFATKKDLKYEAIDYQRRYSELREDKRKSSSSPENIKQNFSELTYAILDFVDLIAEEYNKLHYPKVETYTPTPKEDETEIPPISSTEDNVIYFPEKPLSQEDQITKQGNPNQTPFERAKQLWKKRDKSGVSKNINVVVYASNITKEYSGKIGDFKLSLPELELKFGEITSLVGENGNGKTTLLKIIIGKLAQSSGVVKYPALVSPKKHDWYKIKQQIAYIPQDLPIAIRNDS